VLGEYLQELQSHGDAAKLFQEVQRSGLGEEGHLVSFHMKSTQADKSSTRTHGADAYNALKCKVKKASSRFKFQAKLLLAI